jgi:tRNA nucleotidyltransferase (CCA-adding enzyme)
VRALSRLAKRQGVQAWIVGGAVRDAALGVPVAEIDIAVAGDAERLARELEREGLGRAVFLSRDRPGPRVFRVAGRRPIDIAEVEGGSIAADLGRRDFTINAIAVDLEDGSVLDPFGGLRDLAGRHLRCMNPRNLLEDPLRALRAARFLATHGLRPDRGVLAAARRARAGLRRVAAERIAGELSRLLGSAAASPALSWAAEAGILRAALALRVSEARLRQAARALRALDDRATSRLPPPQRRRLRLALLASRLSLSPRQTRTWLGERRWARQEAEDAARLMVLVEAARAVETRREAWQWILEAGSLAPDALRLLVRRHPPQQARASRLRRLGRRPVHSVAVTGDDLLAWLGIGPGPAVGALLAQLRLLAAMGTVKNRREARHWLSGQVQKTPVTGYNL